MSAPHRIRTVYWKELIDILRDRRTLIAMILVPIVLYPLLMLGSIQAVSYQSKSLEHEKVIIGVYKDSHRIMVQQLIGYDREALEAKRRAVLKETGKKPDLPEPFEDAKIVVFDTRDELEKSIEARRVQIGVVFDGDRLPDLNEYGRTIKLSLLADVEEVRSQSAADRFTAMVRRVSKRMLDLRLNHENLPEAFVDPVAVKTVNLSSPPSILGQILPLVLVLMTITGAIYPAIDLTAGERERGTLESLMVSPVPVIDLIVGKFLVVTTVAIMGATLNLASVTATVYFGGFNAIIAQHGQGVPIMTLVLILLCLIPFAVLMSAIMIAVCSYARTFKEAQNYVTPVILAVLIPGGIAALPATQLSGLMLVMPVGNMVLLTRDFLLGATIPWLTIGMVLVSTTLYAAAAVAVAANVFGKESVVFADAASFSSVFNRSLIRPAPRPSVSMALMIAAILFPVWFYVQGSLSPGPGESASDLLWGTARLMPVFFVILPLLLIAYWKINVVGTFSLRAPGVKYVVAALLIGASAWVPAHEIDVLQVHLFGLPDAIAQQFEAMQKMVSELSLPEAVLLIAIVPAVCEELFFRGLLLSGLSSAARKWTAIVTSAVVFGVFHFILFKIPVTVGMGVVLALLCWNSRSIVPSMLAHLLHNGIGAYTALHPEWQRVIGINDSESFAHLPVAVLGVGLVVFAAGLVLLRTPRVAGEPKASAASAP